MLGILQKVAHLKMAIENVCVFFSFLSVSKSKSLSCSLYNGYHFANKRTNELP
jgi:hypothetical protein